MTMTDHLRYVVQLGRSKGVVAPSPEVDADDLREVVALVEVLLEADRRREALMQRHIYEIEPFVRFDRVFAFGRFGSPERLPARSIKRDE